MLPDRGVAGVAGGSVGRGGDRSCHSACMATAGRDEEGE